MSSLIYKLWLITSDGRIISDEERRKECAIKNAPIKIFGVKWQLDDLTTEITKQYSEQIYGEVLGDRTGIIIREPDIENINAGNSISQDKVYKTTTDFATNNKETSIVIYNADGEKRFRLNSILDELKYPKYLHGARLHHYSFYSNIPSAVFHTSHGSYVVEFNQDTGDYDGRFWGNPHEW